MQAETRKLNVQKQEEVCSKLQDSLGKMKAAFQERESLIPEFQDLMRYYASEQWQADKELAEQGKFDFPHGVLSEDLVYDLYQEQRAIAIAMIRAGVSILE